MRVRLRVSPIAGGRFAGQVLCWATPASCGEVVAAKRPHVHFPYLTHANPFGCTFNAAVTAGAENGAGRSSPRAAHAWVQQLVTGSMGRPAPGVPLVDSWDCLRGMVRAWQDACGSDPTDMDRQYAMKHTRLFANLCNAGLSEDALAEVLEHTGCGSAQQTAAATAAA